MSHEVDQHTAGGTRTVAPGRLPGFIIIGAMKSGTTSLYQLLLRHPQIAMAEPKEPMYFSRDEVYAKGEAWYRSLFVDAGPEQLCGEASTCYSRWPHFGDVPGRIHQLLPDVKLIYIMRHPVERAYSHYGHEMREAVTMTFEQALEQDPAIIDASLYIRQIEQYLRYFRRERMLLLTLDEFKADPDRVTRACQRFLGLPEMDLTREGPVAANRAGDASARQRIMQRLSALRTAPGLGPMIGLVPRGWRQWAYWRLVELGQRSVVGRRLGQRHTRQLSPLRPATRRMLLARFAPATRELEQFLGRPLPGWFE